MTEDSAHQSPDKSGIEGYKKDKFTKEDSAFAEYMEHPEDVCTFIRTHKEFSN